MHVTVIRPDFVLFSNLHLFDLFVMATLVNDSLVGDLVAILDR